MDKQEDINFLFAVATEVKRSFEAPVIFVTMKDYADSIYKSMLDMRSVLLKRDTSQQLVDKISDFHFDWLNAVNEVEAFRKRIRDTPRDHSKRAIEFSIESVIRRMQQFRKFIEQQIATYSAKEEIIMRSEIDIMLGMQENFTSSLRDKQNALLKMVDHIDYHNKILEETEELLNWVDHLYDNLAVQYTQFTGLKFPGFTTDLMKTLKETIDEVATNSNVQASEKAKKFESKSRSLSISIRHNNGMDMERIVEKIKELEDRIEKLKKQENKAALMALEHKTLYLEERLMSLENIREDMLTLKNNSDVDRAQGTIRIFDHLLPSENRTHLVEDLIKLWRNIITNDQEQTSIISILSIADLREIFSDEFGKYTVDKYGRRLYLGEDDVQYQLNENNILVPLSDDENHIYFYDECGRYFYNEENNRIYKAYSHENASEYCIGNDGLLMKVKEYRDGKEYCYDELGRYFLNDEGKRIYFEEDSEYYEHDGLGNLVCIRSVEDFSYTECPVQPIATEDNKYLQRAVGLALRKCIAKVVLCQPSDPVLFLAKSLESFRKHEKVRQERVTEEQELLREREERMRDAYQALTAPGSHYTSSGEEELCSDDPHFASYRTVFSDN